MREETTFDSSFPVARKLSGRWVPRLLKSSRHWLAEKMACRCGFLSCLPPCGTSYRQADEKCVYSINANIHTSILSILYPYTTMMVSFTITRMPSPTAFTYFVQVHKFPIAQHIMHNTISCYKFESPSINRRRPLTRSGCAYCSRIGVSQYRCNSRTSADSKIRPNFAL